MTETQEEMCRCLREMGKIKKKLPERKQALETANKIKLLAHPTRLQILNTLAVKPVCVCVLSRLTGKSQPNISQHLAKLRENGIIENIPKGKLTFYRIKDRQTKKVIQTLG